MEASYLLILGLCTWTLVLLLMLGAYRINLTLSGKSEPHGFKPSNEFGPTYAHRVGRAHANCCENLPLVIGVILFAYMTGHIAITNSLALIFLGLRIAQSITHIISIRARAILIRFAFYVGQCAILIYWLVRLWLA